MKAEMQMERESGNSSVILKPIIPMHCCASEPRLRTGTVKLAVGSSACSQKNKTSGERQNRRPSELKTTMSLLCLKLSRRILLQQSTRRGEGLRKGFLSGWQSHLHDNTLEALRQTNTLSLAYWWRKQLKTKAQNQTNKSFDLL